MNPSERITYTGTSRQIWRQVGWLGASGTFYDLTTPEPIQAETASYSPVWQLVDNDEGGVLANIIADLDEYLSGDELTDPIGMLETLHIRLSELAAR